MAGQYRLICLTSLASVLLNTPMLAASSPLPSLNNTNVQNNKPIRVRAIPQPDADGWIPFDSVGMMLPVKLTDDDASHSTECNTVECKQHMDYTGSVGDAQLPPGLGLSRRDYPRQGSRDIARRKAAVGLDEETGEAVYRLADYDGDDQDDEEDDDDSADEDEEYDEDEGYDNEDDYSDDEDDGNDREALAKRHLPLLRGTSVLGTPTFSRRSEGFLARLFRRKKSNSNKSDSDEGKKRKKNKSKSKGRKLKSKTKALDKVTKKGKGKLKLGGIDLMKGATILTTITWYTGIDLLNPYCDRKTKWTPTDDSMIIAVTEKWSLRPACGEFMEIVTQDDKEPRSIIARVVDLCGGCIPEVPHADLSKAAFSKLYDLDVGRVHGLKMRRVGAPKRWSEKLYGPKTL